MAHTDCPLISDDRRLFELTNEQIVRARTPDNLQKAAKARLNAVNWTECLVKHFEKKRSVEYVPKWSPLPAHLAEHIQRTINQADAFQAKLPLRLLYRQPDKHLLFGRQLVPCHPVEDATNFVHAR